MYKVHRYHDISCGHRVVGHESKCRHLHGHNYRVHFTCVPDAPVSRELGMPKRTGLDGLGRVIDFGVIKERLCEWLEAHWDHRFLHWEEDPLINALNLNEEPYEAENPHGYSDDVDNLYGSLIPLPFNPTAENLARYLVEEIGPIQLTGTGVRLVAVTIEETAKCHATYEAQ